MRIIAGKHKGTKLNEFKLSSVKPTLDRVKEAIFSCIQNRIYGAVVLDLFAGTGALGLEALSRNAQAVTFVDNDKNAIKLINLNLNKIKNTANVVMSDAISYLNSAKNANTQFDIIFIDAPFDSNLGEMAVQFILKNNILKSLGIIVYEHPKGRNFNLENDTYKFKTKKYGAIEIIFIEKIM